MPDPSAASRHRLWQLAEGEPSFDDILGRAVYDLDGVFDQAPRQYNLGASDSDYVNSVCNSFQDVWQPPGPSQTGSTDPTRQSSNGDDIWSSTTPLTETTADNARPFACAVDGCSGRFTTATGLARHVQRCHQRPKVECPVCGTLLSPSGHMAKHLRTHQAREEWKFNCDLCGRKWQRKDQLKRHRNNRECVKARQRIASLPSPIPESSEMAARRLQQRTRATLLPADRTTPASQGSASSTNSQVEASKSASVSGTGQPRSAAATHHPTPRSPVPPPGMGPFVPPADLQPFLLPSSCVPYVLPSGLELLFPFSSPIEPGIAPNPSNEHAWVAFLPSVASSPPPVLEDLQLHALHGTLTNSYHHLGPEAQPFAPDQEDEWLDPRLRRPPQTNEGSCIPNARPTSARMRSEQQPPEHSNAAAPHERDAALCHVTENSSNNQTGSSGRPRWKGKGRQF